MIAEMTEAEALVECAAVKHRLEGMARRLRAAGHSDDAASLTAFASASLMASLVVRVMCAATHP